MRITPLEAEALLLSMCDAMAETIKARPPHAVPDVTGDTLADVQGKTAMAPDGRETYMIGVLVLCENRADQLEMTAKIEDIVFKDLDSVVGDGDMSTPRRFRRYRFTRDDIEREK